MPLRAAGRYTTAAHCGSHLESEMVRQLQRQLELRWYPDWRWRFTRDEAGIAVWCGRVGLYVWRTE